MTRITRALAALALGTALVAVGCSAPGAEGASEQSLAAPASAASAGSSLQETSAPSAPSPSASEDAAPSPRVTLDTSGTELKSGTIDDIVPDPTPQPTHDVTPGETYETRQNVTTSVVSAERIHVEARTPGEVAGPAVAVTVEVSNNSDQTVDPMGTTIDVLAASGEYGQATSSEPNAHFDSVIEPGATARAVYVFLLPESASDPLQVSVQLSPAEPVAIFHM